METQVQDLWPADIGAADLVTPVGILRQQASLLGDKTKNIVEAEVKTASTNNILRHSFLLVAPAMGNYRYVLLNVQHPVVELYPAIISYEPTNTQLTTRSQEEFVEKLGELLSAEKTKNIIKSLIAQSEK